MKYEALTSYLRASGADRLSLSFTEVAAAAQGSLPRSAYRHRPWWANSRAQHTQARAWLDAGYRTVEVDMAAERVVFARLESSGGSGVRDMPQPFEDQAPTPLAEPVAQHPMFGAMKGTFTIDPDWDLTKPAMDEDEMAEWEARLEEKAELYANPHRK